MELRERLVEAAGHLQAGRLQRAQEILVQILREDARCVPALNLMAGVAHRSGNLRRVVEILRQAIEIEPASAGLYVNLGEALARLGQLAEAEAAYRKGLSAAPDMADLHCNLGNVLLAKGDVDGALESLTRAVAMASGFPEAHYNLARAQERAGDLDGSIRSLERAIALREAFPQAHYNLGTALRLRGELEAALVPLRRAVELQPGYAAALNNLGLTLFELRRSGEAAEVLRQAVRYNPDYAAAWTNLGNALARLRDVSGAVTAHRRAVLLNPKSADLASSLLMSLLYDPTLAPDAYEAELRQFGERFGGRAAAEHGNERTADRPLRIGYLSSDFRTHVVARNILPLLERHDRNAFDIVGFYNWPRADEVTERVERLCSAFHRVHGMSDAALADLIRQERIDILVDLNVHSRGNRVLVLAQKPAPVQITFAGYPGSTGLPAVDYRISDELLDPAGTRHGPEAVLHIPSFWCYRPGAEDPEVGTAPVERNGHVTFASLNSPAKLNDVVLALWAKILLRTPGSQLLLLAWDGALRERVTALFVEQGIAAERVRFSEHVPHAAYMRLYQEVDIALDPFPYNGHTTSLDAMWMGVPVVTLAGQMPVGRGGVSQLKNAGMPELIARSADEYVEIACALAGDRARIAARVERRERMRGSVLMDEQRFTRAIEACYRAAWSRWLAR